MPFIDGVHNPVVTHPDPPQAVRPGEHLRPRWARVNSQCFGGGLDSLGGLPIKLA